MVNSVLPFFFKLICTLLLSRMAEFVGGSLITVFSVALHSNTIHFLCTPWQFWRILGLDLPTSSVITSMRGAKAGVSPPRRSPPRKYVNTNICRMSLVCCAVNSSQLSLDACTFELFSPGNAMSSPPGRILHRHPRQPLLSDTHSVCSAGGGLGRALASRPGACSFCFLAKVLFRSQVSICAYRYISV